MVWPKSDQRRNRALRVAWAMLFFAGYVNASFAQSEPPLTVPPAGLLPGPDCGSYFNTLYSGSDIYAGYSLYSNVNGSSTSAGPTSGAKATGDNTLYNLPLYSDRSLYGNVPLYSNPDLGGQAPLYSNPSLYYNSRLYGEARTNTAGANIPVTCRGAIPLASWLLYPSIRLYSIASDNLFLSPTAPIKTIGLGVSPSLTAQWTNGIHTTTIYANVDGEAYTDNTINQLNSEATFTQKYSPLRDLTFTVLGDYTHRTIQSSLTNSIPTAVTTPTPVPTRLANGDIELPNGQIISPSGQIVGQVNPVLANSGTTLVNPYNQYTGTATASKIFNYGVVTLSGSTADTVYQNIQGAGANAFTSFATRTLRDDVAIWLGPQLYAYSDGAFSWRTENTSVNSNSSAYRVVGGIGTRQIGLFRGSVYFGHQGSEVQGSGTAGGDVYGGKISYYPTLYWTVSAAIDETMNISSQTVASNQALTLPVDTPVQVPISSSTRTTTTSLRTQYTISPLWALSGTLGYTHIEFINSSEVTNSWLADLLLSYEIWRNMTLALEYQFTSIQSNVPLSSGNRNLVTVSANYRF
jgi:hypothetical protein